MDSKQESKLNMYNAVINYCDDNTAVVATIAAFQTLLTAFKAKVSSITSTAQLEVQVLTGVAMDKAQLRKDLCQQAADIAAAVFAFASGANNNQLKQTVNFSVSDLLRLKDDLVGPTCQNISDAANANIAALTTYGITAATITSFNSAIGIYSAAVPNPRNAVSLRSTYIATLKILFKEADNILKNQMDKIAPQFRTANMEFYNTYKNNRIIVDAPAAKTQITGKVTASASGSGLNGVAVQIIGQLFKTITDATSSYVLKAITPGAVSLSFSLAGFTPQTINNVPVSAGQSKVVNVALQPV